MRSILFAVDSGVPFFNALVRNELLNQGAQNLVPKPEKSLQAGPLIGLSCLKHVTVEMIKLHYGNACGQLFVCPFYRITAQMWMNSEIGLVWTLQTLYHLITCCLNSFCLSIFVSTDTKCETIISIYQHESQYYRETERKTSKTMASVSDWCRLSAIAPHIQRTVWLRNCAHMVLIWHLRENARSQSSSCCEVTVADWLANECRQCRCAYCQLLCDVHVDISRKLIFSYKRKSVEKIR